MIIALVVRVCEIVEAYVSVCAIRRRSVVSGHLKCCSARLLTHNFAKHSSLTDLLSVQSGERQPEKNDSQ
jgi:hypothetical protein